MATNQKNKNLFAPPTPEELNNDMFAPPREEELKAVVAKSAAPDLFAPPSPAEIEAPVSEAPPLKPTGFEGSLSDADIEQVGKKYGVDPEKLRSIAPYYDAQVQPRGLGDIVNAPKYAAGFLDSQLGGLGGLAYKKTQDPNMRKAIDELRAIAYNQKSKLDIAKEMLAVPASIFKVPASVAGRLATAAGTGAVFGLGGSDEGKEAQSAALGAGIGLGLGGSAEVVGKVLKKWGTANAEKVAANQSKQAQFDIEKETQKVASETAQSEKILDDLVINKKESMTPQEIDTILQEQMSKEKLAQYLDPETIQHAALVRQVGTADEGKLKAALANNVLKERIVSFTEDVVGKRPNSYVSAAQQLDDLYARQGQDALKNRYKQFVDFTNAEKGIERAGLLATETPTAVGKGINFLSDNQFVMRGLDQKYGTRLESVLRDINSAYNRSTFAVKEAREKLGSLFNIAKKEGVDNSITGSTRIYDALDSGNMAGLSEKERTVAEAFKRNFQEMLQFFNKGIEKSDPRIAKMSIPQRENYVPKYMKSTDELVVALENKIKEAEKVVGDNLSGLSSGDIAILSKEEGPVKELIKAAQLLDNKPIQNGVDLDKRLRQMASTREGNIALETKAGSALERNDLIPDFMLEKDLYKLTKKYADTTLKHIYLREGIDKLRYQAKMLDRAGADVESQYVKNLIHDIMGVRKGTFAEATMQLRIKFNRMLDAEIQKHGGKSTFKGGALTAAKAIPEFLEEMTRQIYPNVLGYGAIRPAIQNLTQLVTKTAPELGTKYGYATVLRTAASVIANKDLPRLIQKAQSMGTLPAEFTRAGESAVAEGIRRSAVYAIPADALAGMARVGMKLFSKVEEINRAMVIGVGETMAKDLASGSKWAKQALSKMPKSVQQEVMRNPEMVMEILPRYLNDATMYNYNRVSMSEYGRTMGPLFSAFSKWPTATLGEVINEFRDKGLMRGAGRNWQKFITPLIVLQAIDYAAGERVGEKDGLSDVQKKLIGSHGLSQSAPAGSIGGILKGEIFTPPAVDAVVQTISPLMDGNIPDVGKGAGSAVMNFTPTAGIFRFLFDDLVTYATGERPEGNNPASRVVEGMKQYTK